MSQALRAGGARFRSGMPTTCRMGTRNSVLRIRSCSTKKDDTPAQEVSGSSWNPISRVKAWWNKEDSEDWKQARKEIQKDISKGYFDEMREADTFSAGTSSASLLPAKTAKLFPALNARSLLDIEAHLPVAAIGCVSLVTIAVQDSAQPHVESWGEPLIDTFGDSVFTHSKGSEVRLYRVSVLDGRVGAMLHSLVTSAAKRKTPEERYASVLHWNGDAGNLELELANRYVGYAYLLDREGRVRWRGRGKATPEQAERMIDFARTLLTEPATPKPKLKGKR